LARRERHEPRQPEQDRHQPVVDLKAGARQAAKASKNKQPVSQPFPKVKENKSLVNSM
jgi:hypothetical protein